MASQIRWTVPVLALVVGLGSAFVYSWPAFAGEPNAALAGEGGSGGSGSEPGTNEPPPAITATSETAVVALRVGLSPAAMAAAGLSTNSTSAAISALESHLALDANALGPFDAKHAQARAAHDALERKVRSGLATSEELASLASAKSALAAASSARQAALDAAFSAATANLSSAQRATLATIQANRGWALSTEYLAESRTEPEWVALRDALTNKKQAAAYGEAMDEACSQCLSGVEASSATAAAKSNLAANLAAVTAAFNSAAAG